MDRSISIKIQHLPALLLEGLEIAAPHSLTSLAIKAMLIIAAKAGFFLDKSHTHTD
jgi:hypothetical protein